MDFANRGNRPSQAPQMGGQHNNEQPSQAFQPMNSGNSSEKKSKDGHGGLAKYGPIVMVFAVTVILVALIALLIFGGNGDSNKETDLINTEKYQAVFLDSQDGQVYFGKLVVFNEDMYALTDIFYVRVEQPIQPEGANQQQQANISLAKLGNELHGPEDAMYIRRDKVLYWENLKDDGQVVSAIKEFDANGRQTQSPTQQQTTQPTGTGTQNDTPTDTTDTPAETPTETTPTTP